LPDSAPTSESALNFTAAVRANLGHSSPARSAIANSGSQLSAARSLSAFPVRIDGAVMQSSEAWARLLRGQRNIGDFTGWKDHDSYQKSFERLMRDLRVEDEGDGPNQC
jgi:hypothetical protein